ncbi:MAG TPA: branched-chain amino acid ABC transporter permease [Rubrivivax sp.]|nr:branched-chain amino acid ABC transporter permease [Rubrivivax sp.]
MRSRLNLWLVLGLVLLLAGLMAYGSSYFNQIAITTMIFVILAASLNLITGSAGLLSLGHAAFFGVGAYAAALLSTRLGWPFWLTLPAAGAISAAVGALVAIPTMRLTSIYFAVATLGIGEMIYVTLLNWVGVTRGPMGIRSIPGIGVFGQQGMAVGMAVVALVMLGSLWVVHRLTHSYYGNSLRALREDDACADAMGIDVGRLKLQSFGMACCMAGVAGALFAHTTGYISPESFKFGESILILSMIVVGGLGSLYGSIIGAVLLSVLPELLRDLGSYRMIAVGVVLFLSILFLPKGLVGEVSAIDLIRRQIRRDPAHQRQVW